MKQQLKQLSLLDYADAGRRAANPTRWEAAASAPPDPLAVNSPPFIEEVDGARLSGQMARVFETMKDGNWRTLREITEASQPGGEASISAQLRSLRSKKHGGHKVNRRRRGKAETGLWEYQLIVKI